MPAHHGKGYAREAMRAAFAWARHAFPGQEISCIVAPDNHASLRLAEALGFRRDSVATYKDKATVIFRMAPAGASVAGAAVC
jgi:RimJ/RimL family protein N-acetyltransferase